MSPSSKIKKNLNESRVCKNKILDFITIGVGCNCLVVLSESGVLRVLLERGFIDCQELGGFGNPLCIKSALITLEKCEIVNKVNNVFEITEFGRAISDFMGLITIFFDGYGDLLAKQAQIVKNKIKNPFKLIKGPSVSQASILISEKLAQPIIFKIFDEIQLKGTICDLGCGYGSMLSKICKKTDNPGLGFDNEPQVVKKARKQLINKNISIEMGDISRLEGIWEDVVILMQFHVCHDFTPDMKCIDILNSYLRNFPNMKCFFYLDTVSPSAGQDKILPGFDYIHGLLGIPTRTYEETRRMFMRSKYRMVREVAFPGMVQKWGK